MSGSVLDASGEWTAEEGKYKKVSLCKEYDLDVSERQNPCRLPADARSLVICGN